MSEKKQNAIEELLGSLKERAKELSCIYEVEELLHDHSLEIEDVLNRLISIIPHGLCYPEEVQVSITYNNEIIESEACKSGMPHISADIIVQSLKLGSICVFYRKHMPTLDDGPFLKEEKRLIHTIGERLSQAILHRQLGPVFNQILARRNENSQDGKDWRRIIDMLRLTDQELLFRMSRRMLNYLCHIGIEDAKKLLEQIGGVYVIQQTFGQHEGINRPIKTRAMHMNVEISERIMDLASKHISDEQVFTFFNKWIKENKVSYLIDVLEDHSSSLSDIADSIARFKDSDVKESDLGRSTINALNVPLIRRFFSRTLGFIKLAKQHISLDDFYDLTRHLVYPARSNGRLGGKSAGLFVAMQIIKDIAEHHEKLKGIKSPKTWYIASDGIIDFIHYNHMEELLEYKYRDVDRIRFEYPNVVQIFKNSPFSPEMVQGLSMALDDFGERPLIVRSSSLLEDSIGAAFSGKYKSLFIANQGSKQQRLEALLDAIAEVYSSMFSPDPIEYRIERGLLDFQEEMGIMIQEVVGTRIGGKYLCPAFAGVGFSNNEFRWSPRIRREDGLLRLVPGLGTRAVDRVSDDYPVLVAPGQPNLRVNVTIEEILRYAPKYIDVINLETNSIETMLIDDLIRAYGNEYPRVKDVFSVYRNGMLTEPSGFFDNEKERLVATFDRLLNRTDFIDKIRTVLKVLEDHIGLPIDIEFAADDKDFYLLQCRPQSSIKNMNSVEIPKDANPDKIIFTANRHITDGLIDNISHIVYVSPLEYDKLEKLEDLQAVGQVVGKLNSILPKRQFILMGPGRWGSRGDIKLGVNVTYSDINNTAALIEVGFRKGNYLPDLSFGTHFFQDLVEASIHYLPLYPDDQDALFNSEFLNNAPNILGKLLPEYEYLSSTIKVIDIPGSSNGQSLRILMNGNECKAMALLGVDNTAINVIPMREREQMLNQSRDEHWIWRLRMAERIAASIDPQDLDVKGVYVFGSTKNATAKPCSDIDLLVHIGDDTERHEKLKYWLDGWSRCLGEMNYLRTGYETQNILDVHYVTDEDIHLKKTFAAKIGAVSDAARELAMGTQIKRSENNAVPCK